MSETTGPAGPYGLLTPASRAVAGLALAVAGLLGSNALTASLQVVFMSGPQAGDPGVFGVLSGFATAVPAGLALFLTWRVAKAGGSTWPAQLSRAAVLIASAVLLGALLMVVGGFLLF